MSDNAIGNGGVSEVKEPTTPDSDYDESLAFPYLDGVNDEIVHLDDKLDSDEPDTVVIPFQSIHKPPVKFKSPQRKLFIPNKEIEVKIINFERNVTIHLLNPNLYTIEFQHGGFKWTVSRRYKHFESLHRQLRLFRASLTVPFPTKNHRERRTSFRMEMNDVGGEGKKGASRGALPRFPSKPDALLPYDQIEHRIEQLEEYLRNLLRINFYRNHYETLSFMEVSHLSFVHGLGSKGREGMVQKRTGSTQPGRAGCNFCGLLNQDICVKCHHFTNHTCGGWRQRWMFVKDTCVGYIRPTDGVVKCVMLLDSGFEVSTGIYAAGMPTALQITNLSRNLIIRDWTKRKIKEWASYLKEVASSPIGREFVQKNRYDSYAPVRSSSLGAWYVDGSSYMEAVANALDAAREEIFIADWWLSPEIFLKRRARDRHWQLHNILKRKAEEGVKIFVMLYKEVELALGINSYYSKQRLVSLHPENIKVLRHPDHAKAGVFLWAHHEKIVVVDQSIAFLGGIDLCYGRWDDPVHRLTDVGGVQLQPEGLNLPKVNSSRQVPPTVQPRAMLSLAEASNAIGVGVFGPTLDLDPGAATPNGDVPEGEEVEGDAVVADRADFIVFTPMRMVESDSMDLLDEMEVGPSPENIKCDTPEMPRRSIVNEVRSVTKRGKDWLSKLYSPGSELEEGGGGGDEAEAGGKEDSRLEGEEEMAADDKGHSRRMRFSRTEAAASGEGTPIIDKEDAVAMDGGVAGEKEEEAKEGDMKATEVGEAAEGEKVDESEEGEEDGSSLGDDGIAPRSFFHRPLKDLEEPDFVVMNKHWIGKDYTNFIVKDFSRLDLPYHDFINRNVTPRMPWHDIGVMVQGAPARDVSRHFIQRWNAAKEEKARLNALYPYLLPKSYDNLEKVPYIPKEPLCTVDVQVLRSVSCWSAGFIEGDTNEESIHLAYIDAINKAKYYIYIENQFFITHSGGRGVGQVKNQIGDSLLQRIVRAHREGSTFRVYVVMPLLPGFEGEVGTSTGTSLHAITHWNYSSICRGKDALLNRLKEAGIDPKEYISFYGLRTHSVLHNDLVTELIYVHSKLMIVDDKIVICGSANINDRSLLGKRDSEIAVIVEDKEFVESSMNGKLHLSGKYASSLRKSLFREHLGILDTTSRIVDDPISGQFYHDVWMSTAAKNTEIFEEVFKCIPSDAVPTFFKLKKYQDEIPLSVSDPSTAKIKLQDVKGHLVFLPLNFLEGENLTPNPSSVTGLMPTNLWT
ncbi:phospholipase D1 [Ischnura elegans]|uniref:phospholipase D1 n=1 Tax=Ischnura elegans TaxID=197161 RepID=UPI001ED87301|nr:phospholipase D1 [Ischnura elegans]